MTERTGTALSLRAQELRQEMEGLNTLADSFGQKLVTSLAGAVIHGRKLSDVFRGLALSMANQALGQALRPLGNLLGGALAGRATPFAAGGIVNSPVLFPLAQGAGLMGEAGPEAIMPLARGSDGKLGVRGGGGRAVQVTINIATPDVASFRQAQGQIAAQLARAVTRGERNS
ncbi:MAG: phage tail tape measure protein [Proteobacteria bacterium]|nr:phage tail tape measure protein [Pseudomonadota bacterium]